MSEFILASSIDARQQEMDPLQSIINTIAFSSADFGAERDRAWLYGIVLGWDDSDPELDAMTEIATRFEWSTAEVARLRSLHASFNQLTGRTDD